MKVGEVVNLSVPRDKKITRVKASSFHPVQQKISVSFFSDVYEYDLVTGSCVSHFRTASEITHLAHGYTHNVLVAACKNGSFYIWELTNCTLQALHTPTKSSENKPILCMAVSRKRPILFYSKVKSSTVYGLQMFSDSRSMTEYAHKKSISSLTVHPKKPILATASSDGVIKLWSIDKNQLRASFDENPDKKMRTAVTSLCFFPSTKSGLDLLATGTKNGRILIWEISTTYQKVLAKINTDDWINNLYFHPKLPCLMALNAKGSLKFITIGHIINNFIINGASKNSMTGMLQLFDMVETFYVPTHDTSPSIDANQRYMEYFMPLICADMDENTGSLAFFGKTFQLNTMLRSQQKGQSTIAYYPIYSILDTRHPESTLPLCETFNVPLDTFVTVSQNQIVPEYIFNRPQILYLDVYTALPNTLLMTYAIVDEISSNIQLIKASQSPQDYFRCYRALFDKNKERMLIFFEKLRDNSYKKDDSVFSYMQMKTKSSKDMPPLEKGMDGGYLGDTKSFVILDENELMITLYNENGGGKSVELQLKLRRLFTSPHDTSILYYSNERNILGWAISDENPEKNLQMDLSSVFHLRDAEIPLQVQFCNDRQCGEDLVGVITSQRVIILSKDMKCLGSVEAPKNESYYFHSCVWLANILVYNTNTGVFCLNPYTSNHQSEHHICTLDYPQCTIVGIMADRIVFAAQKSKKTEIFCRYIAIAELLLDGIVSIPKNKITFEKRLELIQIVTERFDCRTISENSLRLLEQNGYADLASELVSESQYTFSWQIRFKLALSALNFSYAFDILKGQLLEEVDQIAYVTESSHFFPYFVDLAQTSIDYGQFDIAKKCFDTINDVWSLFKIFSSCDNTKALQLLAERCEQSPELYSVYLACSYLIDGETSVTDHKDAKDSQNVEASARVKLDVSLGNWTMKVEEEDVRNNFYIGNAMKGNIKFLSNPTNQEQQSEDAPPKLEEIDTENLGPLELTDFTLWMGYREVEPSAEVEDGDIDLEDANFQQDGFGGGEIANPISEAPDVATHKSSDDESESSSKKQRDNVVAFPIGMKEGDEDTVNDEITKRPDSDDSSDEEDSFEAKNKLFRKIRIKQNVVKPTNQSPTLSFGPPPGSGFLMPPPGGVSDPAPLGSNSTSNAKVPSIGLPPPPVLLPPPGSVSPSTSQEQETPRHQPPPKAQKADIDPALYLKKGIMLLEQAKYKESKSAIKTAISALAKDNSQILKKTNIILCIRYQLLISVLEEIQRLEREKSPNEKACLLSTFACLIPDLKPKHAVICKNMSIKRNMEMGNFGIAAKFLKEQLPITPAQFKGEVTKRLKHCEDQELKNNDPSFDNDFDKLSFCWSTFEIIPDANYLECTYCPAIFQPNGTLKQTQSCVYCHHGELNLKDTEATSTPTPNIILPTASQLQAAHKTEVPSPGLLLPPPPTPNTTTNNTATSNTEESSPTTSNADWAETDGDWS